MKTITSILCALFWSGLFAPHSGATIYNSNGSAANIQSIHDTQAVDGDTITLPAGTFSWTTHVEITKGITIQGQTTISGAGGSNPVIADNTIVEDNSNHRTNLLALVKSHGWPDTIFSPYWDHVHAGFGQQRCREQRSHSSNQQRCPAAAEYIGENRSLPLRPSPLGIQHLDNWLGLWCR